MSERVVQCSCLGSMGRFGNQLFQYAFARAYAEANDARLETPDWVGRRIFKGVDRDPLISSPLPRLDVDQMPAPGQVNIDLHGFFQGKRWTDWYSREWARGIFNVRCDLKERCRKARYPWTSPYTAVHIRHGDYIDHLDAFCIVSSMSYVEAFELYDVDMATALVVSEEKPIRCVGLDDGLSFLPDFIALRDASTLFRGNSTFSWWAATLGYGDVYSPDIKRDDIGHRDVTFVKGNACRTFAAGQRLPIRESCNEPVETWHDMTSSDVATLLKGVGR